MPEPPNTLRILPIVIEDDLAAIQAHNPDHAARILQKINDWEDKIQWVEFPKNTSRTSPDLTNTTTTGNGSETSVIASCTKSVMAS